MTYELRELAQLALKEILIGKQIVGMYFRTANIYFAAMTKDDAIIPDSAYLRIENTWSFVEKDGVFPPLESNMLSRSSWQELAHIAVNLGPYKVSNVILAEDNPNLVIHFDNGGILYISGFNPVYESWEVIFGIFDIVATPNNTIAVWTPDDFNGSL
jgi:hypothetical protein